MCFESNDEPDYGPMVAASDRAAQLGYDLGQQQLAESRRQYENNIAVARPVVDAQLGLMRAQKEQGDEYYEYMKDTFRPVEQGLVKDATDFNTADAKERFARQAAADLEGQQANQEAQESRAMAAMGVNPNSGRFQGLSKSRQVINAAQRAGATTNARVQADNLGWAKRMDVTGLGRGLTGASQGAYSMSVNAGNSAVGNNAQAGDRLVAGTSASNGTAMQGQALGLQGLGSVLGSQTSRYNAELNNSSQNGAAVGSLVGTGLGVAAKVGWLSSKELKDGKKPLDGESVVRGLQRIPVEAWQYKDGVADEGHHIGPYAEDIHREFGDAAAPGGDALDPVSMNGLTIAAVKNLADRMVRVEKSAGLSKIK